MPQELKNVVVVGGGPYAGAKAASGISAKLPSTHRVILIDARSFAYTTGIAARASVVPTWEKDVAMPIAGLFEKGSRHIALTGFKVISFTGSSVTLDKPADGFGTTIEADAIVLATASKYSYPATVELPTIEAVREQLVKSQQEIAKAKDILVIGSGPYGVEYAGEVADQFPRQKNITIVSSGPALIGGPFPAKLGRSLATQLEQRGVKIIYNDRVEEQFTFGPIEKRTITTRNGVAIEADYVLPATGSKVNSDLAKGHEDVIGSDGRFKVKPTFQLDSPELDRVFAVGDSIDLGLTRTAAAATFQMPTLVKNVIARVNGKALSEYKPSSAEPLFVTVGLTGGAATVFGWVLPPFLVRLAKSRDLMKGGVHKMYRYDPAKPLEAAA